MTDLTSINAVEFALNSRMTAKQFLNLYIDQGYMPYQVVTILSGLLPHAYNGLNKDAVKLICNAIKYC